MRPYSFGRDDFKPLIGAAGAEEFEHGWKKELLPRVRADGVAEESLIGAPLEPVGSSVLLVGPAGGQISRRGKLSVHDGPIPNGGADELIASLLQHVKQHVKRLSINDLHSVSSQSQVMHVVAARCDAGPALRCFRSRILSFNDPVNISNVDEATA
jgi:hypothetical protein